MRCRKVRSAACAPCLTRLQHTPRISPITKVIGRELRVGDGQFSPLSPEVWAYSLSGLQTIDSWLGYRMKRRSEKKSSPLDEIRPERWTPTMTDDFLELIWVIEATVGMEAVLTDLLDRVVSGECFTAAELPTSTPDERTPPRLGPDDKQFGLFGKDDDSEDEED
jgi:hypothetical protein